jgi:DNA polymerase-1
MKALFPSFILIDFKNTVMRAWHAGQSGDQEDAKRSDGYPSGHVLRFFRMIHKLKKECGGGQLVFCMEGGETRRYELLPTYKEGRSKPDFDPAPDVVKMIQLMKCKVVTPVSAEADDAIATFVATNKGGKHFIVSVDKDLWSLLGGKVRILSAQNEITEAKVLKTFGVKPSGVALAKALVGDASDKIPKVPYLLWKDIASAMETALTPEDLYNQIDKIPPKTATKLLEYKEQVEKMFEVVSLRKDCELLIDERPGNSEEMKAFLESFECASLIPLISTLTEAM